MTFSAKITSHYEVYAEAMYKCPDKVGFDRIAEAIGEILAEPNRTFPAIHVWMTEADPRAATIKQRYAAAVAGGSVLPPLVFKGPRKLSFREQRQQEAADGRAVVRRETAISAAMVAAASAKTAG